MTKDYPYVLFLILVLAFFSGCEDLLPPYDNPSEMLQGSVRVTAEERIYYSHVDYNDPVLLIRTLSYSSASAQIDIGVTNIFDETLEDVAAVSGTLEIFSEEHPEYKATINLNEQQLITPAITPGTNILMIHSGQTIWFRTTWRYRLDDGMPLFLYVDRVDEGQKRKHSPVRMVARAIVRIFKDVNPVRTPDYAFPLVFEGTIIPPP